jgi:hypothetical protein
MGNARISPKISIGNPISSLLCFSPTFHDLTVKSLPS